MAFILLLSLLWLAANPVDLAEASFFGLRHAMMDYTGILAMGMMMLSPLIISLPFKIMLFVMVDGWVMIMGTLANSFGMAL